MLKSALVAVLSVCLVLTACTTTRNVPFGNLPVSQAPALSPGETVDLLLKSGQKRRLKVAAVDAETVTGRDLDARDAHTSVQIALADVQTIEARHTAGWRTGGLMLGIIAGLGVLVVGGLLVAQCGATLDDCGD